MLNANQVTTLKAKIKFLLSRISPSYFGQNCEFLFFIDFRNYSLTVIYMIHNVRSLCDIQNVVCSRILGEILASECIAQCHIIQIHLMISIRDIYLIRKMCEGEYTGAVILQVIFKSDFGQTSTLRLEEDSITLSQNLHDLYNIDEFLFNDIKRNSWYGINSAVCIKVLVDLTNIEESMPSNIFGPINQDITTRDKKMTEKNIRFRQLEIFKKQLNKREDSLPSKIVNSSFFSRVRIQLHITSAQMFLL